MTRGGEECAAQGLSAPAEWCEWEAAGGRKAFAVPGSVLLMFWKVWLEEVVLFQKSPYGILAAKSSDAWDKIISVLCEISFCSHARLSNRAPKNQHINAAI